MSQKLSRAVMSVIPMHLDRWMEKQLREKGWVLQLLQSPTTLCAVHCCCCCKIFQHSCESRNIPQTVSCSTNSFTKKKCTFIVHSDSLALHGSGARPAAPPWSIMARSSPSRYYLLPHLLSSPILPRRRHAPTTPFSPGRTATAARRASCSHPYPSSFRGQRRGSWRAATAST